MSKPHHAPGTGTHEAEGTSSANVSNRGEMTDQAKSEIKETFKPGKGYDVEMEAKFGKEPSEQDIIAQFASQEKFKGKNFQDILTQLEQDENKPMADRLRKKVSLTKEVEIPKPEVKNIAIDASQKKTAEQTKPEAQKTEAPKLETPKPEAKKEDRR